MAGRERGTMEPLSGGAVAVGRRWWGQLGGDEDRTHLHQAGVAAAEIKVLSHLSPRVAGGTRGGGAVLGGVRPTRLRPQVTDPDLWTRKEVFQPGSPGPPGEADCADLSGGRALEPWSRGGQRERLRPAAPYVTGRAVLPGPRAAGRRAIHARTIADQPLHMAHAPIDIGGIKIYKRGHRCEAPCPSMPPKTSQAPSG
ncbi:hypothetical protein SKAU_G00143870 [Synaphobranchus kaupii]|uniref:Uncharacterized protein n=1 Tax=Synaphobranchus kaupii TaxID=118154 RepID=A0A9Q1J490_SYNKA|nr:hypothetical protein SKAU_G00143870 [Synaphobranchus kaupii]